MSTFAFTPLVLRRLPRPDVPSRYLAVVAVALLCSTWWGLDFWLTSGAELSSLTAFGWSATVTFWGPLLWAVAPAVTLWRPRVGGAVAVAPGVVWFVGAGGGWPLMLFGSLVGCAAVATWRSPRAAAALTVAAVLPVLSYLVGTSWGVLGLASSFRDGVTFTVVALQSLLLISVAVAALGLGTWMRSSYLTSQRAAGLASRAADVERTSVVVSERARLARDLHDVVAHHVSLIAVRAETAPYTVPDLSPGATALMAEIADDSRRALDELRGVLGILGRSTDVAERAPQPGAVDIAGLVASARRGGDDVVWTGADLSRVAAAPGYVAYRVVQEALTNARRHAPGVPVLVDVVAVGRGVLVRVENEASTGILQEGGHGLVGMRERVEALGGTLLLTSTGGTVRVEASLPGTAP